MAVGRPAEPEEWVGPEGAPDDTSRLYRFLRLPIDDLDTVLGVVTNRRALVVLFLGLLLGWWVYVPVHEGLHVLGCMATGGTVERLELSPLYGGRVLERISPLVVAAGPYAGRLAGFEPNGDLGWAATTLTPYLLTLLPGLWLLRRAARRRAAFVAGLAMPMAFAPWISLPGDTYELGSLAVVQWPGFPNAERELVVGDDVLVVLERLRDTGVFSVAGLAVALAIVVGLFWAFVWTHLADWIAHKLGEPRYARP